ncbi:LamG-like jellyroll fold domain-containing protein [Thalassobellus suaedae]|uniref:LamG-like jellyroll fold domain-containing protein n=1 Tax=Thalassobellus suaedae TaxID=3074124 RepID=A0ABY9XXR5_9FLAO|nr:LamG-like jellyroll fold domain-containing protein [Flavobacteriaceae bacterium HL-DH14]
MKIHNFILNGLIRNQVPFATIATTDFDATGYTDLTVQNGMTYYYIISAFNDAGDSGDSPVVMSDPDFGQHLYYNFNENTGTETNDQWGLYSGMFGSSAAWTNGKDGSGIDLTGASNSYMEIEDGVVKDLTDFTIAIWVKLDALTNWTRIFDFGNNTNEYMFLTPQNGGTGKYRFAIKNGENEQQINCSVSPVIGVWSHVVITMEGSVGVMYIDGVEVGRNEDFTIYPSDLDITTQNYIGKSQFNDPYLNGAVDEFRIYNRAFTPTEVTALKDRTLDVEDNALKYKYEYKFLSTDKTISAVYNGNGTAKYKVFALTGQLLSSGEIVSREVNQLGYYKTGIYIVQVKDLSGVGAFKVLVK